MIDWILTSVLEFVVAVLFLWIAARIVVGKTATVTSAAIYMLSMMVVFLGVILLVVVGGLMGMSGAAVVVLVLATLLFMSFFVAMKVWDIEFPKAFLVLLVFVGTNVGLTVALVVGMPDSVLAEETRQQLTEVKRGWVAITEGAEGERRVIAEEIEKLKKEQSDVASELNRDIASLTAVYRDLSARREKLAAGDAEALDQYNLELADYKVRKDGLAVLRKSIDDLDLEIGKLESERAKVRD